jgi:hypothetical protein
MKFNNVKIIILRSLLNEILLIAGWLISHPKFEGKGQPILRRIEPGDGQYPQSKPCWVHFYARKPRCGELPSGLGFGRGSPMPRTESDRDFSDPVVFGQKVSILVPDPVRVRSLTCQLSVGSVCSYVLTRQMSGRTRD